jgi:DNA replication protein DnaC
MGVIKMLDNPTIQKLNEMKLKGMSRAFAEQQENPDIIRLSFEERLGLVVEAEWFARRNRRIERFIQTAKFRFAACVEDINYEGKQGITKEDVLRLGAGNYILKKQNVILTGLTGVGKTYLACALGAAGCRQNIQTRYYRMADLQLEMSAARFDGTYAELQKKLSHIPLLILDDWGLKPFTIDESHDMLEIAESRYQQGSTIFVGQLPHTKWHELFPDPTLADAILDRIIHNAHKFNIKGETMRKTLAEKDF